MLAPPGAAKDAVTGVGEDHQPAWGFCGAPHRIGRRDAIGFEETVSHTPCHVCQVGREALRQGRIFVSHHDVRPAAGRHVEPGLHRKVGNRHDAGQFLVFAGPGEPLLHGARLRGQKSFLVRDQRDAMPGHGRPDLAAHRGQEHACGVNARIEQIVGLGAMPNESIGRVDDALCDAGMMI